MPKKTPFSTASSQQRKRLLDALAERGPLGVTTIYAREELDVMAPAPRIFELRHNYGYNIQLIREPDTNAQGYTHICGRYVLMPGKWEEVKAA